MSIEERHGMTPFLCAPPTPSDECKDEAQVRPQEPDECVLSGHEDLVL